MTLHAARFLLRASERHPEHLSPAREAVAMYSERPSRVAGGVVWTSTSSRPVRILPDGCMDLLWDGERLLIAGPDTAAFVSPGRAGNGSVGLRLPPGVGPAVFGLPAHELRDQRVPLDAVWNGRAARRIAPVDDGQIGDLDALGNLDALGRWLEDIAIDRLREHAPAPETPAIADALGRGVGVDEVSRAFGLSNRQLHRRSLVAFGYGPKLLTRILRMQRALNLARTGMRLAETAALAGYADQAHQARDVRQLAGVPLGRLV